MLEMSFKLFGNVLMRQRKILRVLIVAVLGCAFGPLFSLGVPAAQAADYVTYSGYRLGAAPIIAAAPGETKTIDLVFKNTGKVAWSGTGRAYVSAYTIRPHYHPSLFSSSGWTSSDQTPRITEHAVAPGRTGTIRLAITAPNKPGTYVDDFQLAAENTSWIWGAWTPITVKVSGGALPTPVVSPPPTPAPGSAPAPAPVTPPTATTDDAPVQPTAALVDRGAERIEAPGGVSMTMHLIYRNDGLTPWKKVGLHVVAFSAPSGGDQTIDDASWASPDIPVAIDRYVPRGRSVDLYFTFTTPRKSGEYRLTYDFTADGGELSNAPIVLPIKVIADAAVEPVPLPSGPSPVPPPPPAVSVGEPILRVGLYTSANFEDVSFDGPYDLRDANGLKLASFAAGGHAQFSYDLSARVYRVSDGVVNVASPMPIRFVPARPGEIFTLWSDATSFNQFRGTLEMRKNDPNDYVWVIDELPMEQYLKGMGETSSSGPLEYQKAMATAARSYANWHYTHPGKHWNFTVDATYDQVYRGVVAERRNPTLTEAVDATVGQVVTYQGEAVITPYYSSSDGRTRAWTEVWGGDAKPWLVSVSCPYDAAAGRALLGHGVGLSAWDAVERAAAGATYDTILKYYYTGTDLKKLY